MGVIYMPSFKEQEFVEYFSVRLDKWIPALIIKCNSDGTWDLDCGEHVDAKNLKKTQNQNPQQRADELREKLRTLQAAEREKQKQIDENNRAFENMEKRIADNTSLLQDSKLGTGDEAEVTAKKTTPEEPPPEAP